ncbi:hypothetical protein RR48_11664 [Papilio machaon]|uniref:Uncharacterized protein n=1 Tax=Papilio machaon TaxID=76193 RepID=A0A194R3M6_PAPMA|nr:hypothetical protein RR48_11664 [Papilio machaon]
MDSHWTDENKIDGICNDQKRNKPINIYNVLNTKTPENYVFEEELENNDSCDQDFQSGPNLEFIQQMLHLASTLHLYISIQHSILVLVKGANTHTEISQDTDVIEISKFTNVAQQNNTQANANVTKDNNDIEKLLNKKKQRNVAIESILEGISNECNLMSLEDNEIEYKNEQQVKLLKPEDFVLKSESSPEVSKANNKCDISVKGLITEASAFVFKKKSPELTIRDSNYSPKSEPKSDAYQPSSMAELYYKKYLERSKFKEKMQQLTEETYEKIKANNDSYKIRAAIATLGYAEVGRSPRAHSISAFISGFGAYGADFTASA